MKKKWEKIKFWMWWYFKATESQKAKWDVVFYGRSFMKKGKRINPKKFYE